MRTRTLHIASAAFAAALLPGVGWAQDCTPDARRVVDAIYRQVLERNANGEGSAAVSQLNSGSTTVRELVRNIAKSNEHRQRFTPGAPASAVTYAYRHLLGREPDAGGLQAHTQVLKSEDINAVIDNMIDSAEYQQLYSDDTVPGAKLRYCGPGSSSSTSANTNPTRMRFQAMDTNRNGAIERGEWNGSDQSFNVHDWNNDGVLSREEVRVGGRRAGRIAEEDDFNPNGPATWTTRNFTILDRNRDNRISASEWYYAPEFFRRADRDRNGSLSAVEFTGQATPVWDDDRDDSFENLDANNNGRIERGEWHGTLDAFQWLDRNRDNWLSRTEVVGDTTGAGAASTFDTFVSLDYNKNNSLEFAEWRWSRRSFDRYDTNGDSRVTRQEFTAGGGTPTAATVR